MMRTPQLCPHTILGVTKCEVCKKEMNRKATAKYKATHREKVLNCLREYSRKNKIRRHEYYLKNREIYAKHDKEYIKLPEHKMKANEAMKRYRDTHKKQRMEYAQKYHTARLITDIEYKIRYKLRILLWHAFNMYTKTGKTFSSSKYGINYIVAISKLITTLPPDYLTLKYHIDHIKPVSSFDLTKPEEVKKCFSPENLQWLLAKENMSKNNKTMEEYLKSKQVSQCLVK